MPAMADERAFIFDNRMAGSDAKPMPERPTDDACERRFLAEPSPTMTGSDRPVAAGGTEAVSRVDSVKQQCAKTIVAAQTGRSRIGTAVRCCSLRTLIGHSGRGVIIS